MRIVTAVLGATVVLAFLSAVPVQAQNQNQNQNCQGNQQGPDCNRVIRTPEPATLLLIGTGALVTGLVRYRRKKKSPAITPR
jgi:hypothetical protein